ncbi:MAG: hypothetical protein ACRD4D_08400 [Candidatus Acidiferrales bacterium]
MLWPSGAAAQEAAVVRLPLIERDFPLAIRQDTLPPPQPESPVFLPLVSWWEEFEEESRRVRAEYERHPLERYHYVHNDRWHPVVFNFVTGYFSESSYYFRHWYSSAKGVTPLRLAGGRLWLGVEFRRVLVFEADRRYSGPFPTPEPCYALGRINSTLCYTMTSFREGERRYGLTVRINLN